jgi:MAX-like protein X
MFLSIWLFLCSVCQSQLPDTGAPVVRHKTSKVMDMYKEYVRQKTLQDWKFWIFSTIAEPMAESFNNSVSAASFEDMCRTTLSWSEQHCSLITLRPSKLTS